MHRLGKHPSKRGKCRNDRFRAAHRYSSSTSVSSAARKNQLPSCLFNSSVFLPIQPRPASCANSRSNKRRGIHDAAHFGGRNALAQPIAKLRQARANQIVIVAAPGVARNPPLPWLRRLRVGGAVVHRQHHDAARAVEHELRIGGGLGTIGQIVHLPGVTGGQPLGKSIHSRRRHRRANAAQIETQPPGFGLQIGSDFNTSVILVSRPSPPLLLVVTGFAAVYCRGWFGTGLKQH